MNWLDPMPRNDVTRIRSHTDVSRDPRYTLQGPDAVECNAECTSAPIRIPPWVLPAEEIQALVEEGHGIAPDLIYAKEVPDTPDPGQINFDKKSCTLVLVETSFSRDPGCEKKHAEKTEK